MGVRKRRLTLGRLMAVVGVVALGFAMPRVDATPAVSACVFAACSWYLAVRRYNEAMAGRPAEGAPARGREKARVAVRCFLGAALAIGLPDAAFLGGYYGYMAAIRGIQISNQWRPELEPQHIVYAAVVGIAAALYVAAMMRRLGRGKPRGKARPTPSTELLAAREGECVAVPRGEGGG